MRAFRVLKYKNLMKNSSYFYAKAGQKLKISIGTKKIRFGANYVGNPIDLHER
jgi:hypothetical protein